MSVPTVADVREEVALARTRELTEAEAEAYQHARTILYESEQADWTSGATRRLLRILARFAQGCMGAAEVALAMGWRQAGDQDDEADARALAARPLDVARVRDELDAWSEPVEPKIERVVWALRDPHPILLLARRQVEAEMARRDLARQRLVLRLQVLTGRRALADAARLAGLSRAQWDAFCATEDLFAPEDFRDRDFPTGWIVDVAGEVVEGS